MDTPSEGGRRYTDREVRLILKSAVELQHDTADAREPSGGLSLAELQQVAAETGIDPTVVRRAAAALDGEAPAERGSRFLGGPTEIVVERIVDAPLDPARFDEILAAIRAETRQLGELSSVGRLFGWRGRLDGPKTEMSVGPAGERTQIRVRVELDEVALAHFMLKGTLLGVGGGLATSAFTMAALALGPVGLVFGGAVLSGGYLWARWGFQSAVARSWARAGGLLATVAAALEAPPVPAPPTPRSLANESAGTAPGGRYSAG